ncbi:MAG: elongation factor P [Bacilli bacterium]|nr:elongation factor P [Bacilli bacterium]
MAIEAGDFRTGLTLLIDGDPWVVLDFMHVKPGKGAAILKTKMKNLKTGSTQERNFNASTKFEPAEILRKTVQYSYNAGETYCFMDMETFEQFELDEQKIGFNKYFLVEGNEATIIFFEGQVLSISVPEKVELEVVETTPAVKNASMTATKDAVTNTGLKLRVPMFIEQGEKIIVFSADGKYSSRA